GSFGGPPPGRQPQKSTRSRQAASTTRMSGRSYSETAGSDRGVVYRYIGWNNVRALRRESSPRASAPEQRNEHGCSARSRLRSAEYGPGSARRPRPLIPGISSDPEEQAPMIRPRLGRGAHRSHAPRGGRGGAPWRTPRGSSRLLRTPDR